MEVRESSPRKLYALALAFAIVFAATLLSAAMPAKAWASVNHTYDEAVAYANSLVGNVGNYDHAGAGCDCVDVAKKYCYYLTSSVGLTGDAYKWASTTPSGFTRVYSPQPGDIATWGAKGDFAPWGHVAVVLSVSGSDIIVVEQRSAQPTTNAHTYKYSASSPSSYLRPDYKSSTPSLTEVSVAEGYYTIRSKVGSGAQFLDVADGTDANTTNLQTYEAEDNRAQTFYVKWCSEHGGYIITMLNSSRMLDTINNGKTGNVFLYDHTGANGQHWKFYDAGDGYRYIMNLNGGYLDVGDGICANGTNVGAWTLNQSDAQKWMLAGHSGVTKKTDVEAGYYTLQSACGNVVLDIAGGVKGGNAQVYQPVNNTNQLFQVYKNATGGGYAFQCVTNGVNWLGTVGNTCGSGANVLDQAGDGSYGQNWFIEDAGGGYVYIRNKWGYYLDVYNAGTADGTNVQVWGFNGSSAQKWKLVKSSGKGATAVASDSYLIRSAADSSLALSAAGDGTANDENIQLACAQSTATQVFAVGNKNDLAIKEANVNYHYLDLAATGKRIVGYSNTNGPTNAILFSGTSENNNCWAFEDAGDGNYYIRDRWGYYLTASDVEAGGNVKTASFTGKDNQKWQLDSDIDWTAYADSITAASSVDHGINTYTRFDTNVGWDEAEAICEALGGHLVTIADADEQAAVQNLISGAYNIYAIGCTDAEEEGAWKWITGEEFSYNNWDPQAPEPNNGTAANYGFMVGVNYGENKQVGEWIDEPEHTSNQTFYNVAHAGFVCEYEGLKASVSTELAKQGEWACINCEVLGDRGYDVAYQWQYSTDGGETWADWTTNGTDSALLVQALAERADWMFCCTASTADGRSSTSDAIKLELAEADGYSVWTSAGELPEGAQVVDEKWTYTAVETAESTSASMEGYTQTGSKWNATGSGTNYYASLPAGFDTGNSLYGKYNNAALSAYETDSAKRTVSTAYNNHIYWHWTCNKYEISSGNYNVLIEDAYCWVGSKEYYNFRAFETTADASHSDPNGVNGGDCFYYWRNVVEDGSWWWFRFDTYKQTYTDYEKIYTFERLTEGCESDIEIAEGDTARNVEHLVRYEMVAAGECEHAYAEATVEPTCEQGGMTVHVCTKCGDTYTSDERLALGHSWGEPAEGATELVCTRCGATQEIGADELFAAASVEPAAVGSYAAFTCDTNVEGATYQWQYRKTETGKWINSSAEGATTAEMSYRVLPANLGYAFRCVVTGADGIETASEPVSIAVKAPEVSAAAEPGAVGFTTVITCTTDAYQPTYQWQYRKSSTGKWITSSAASATSAVLSYKITEANQGYEFRCVVTDYNGDTYCTDACGFTISDEAPHALATVEAAATAAGQYATFTASSNLEGCSYQWQYSKNGTKWINAKSGGATTSTLSYKRTASNAGYTFRVVVTSASGATFVASDPVTFEGAVS